MGMIFCGGMFRHNQGFATTGTCPTRQRKSPCITTSMSRSHEDHRPRFRIHHNSLLTKLNSLLCASRNGGCLHQWVCDKITKILCSQCNHGFSLGWNGETKLSFRYNRSQIKIALSHCGFNGTTCKSQWTSPSLSPYRDGSNFTLEQQVGRLSLDVTFYSGILLQSQLEGHDSQLRNERRRDSTGSLYHTIIIIWGSQATRRRNRSSTDTRSQ
mmetsp:Transcript_15973/g.29049  ORF Transcript_15973/g.29049 Transcript_15973/m.29049 type:complete len:213 (-) Transcript_15973:455-1093(-)